MKRIVVRFSAVVATIVMVVATAEAGSTANAEPKFEAEKIVAFAKKVEKAAAARGARVFIVGRIGRPDSELPDGVEYTHVAFGVYSIIKTEGGREIPGYAMYNLYQKPENPKQSKLVVDYPINFYTGAYELKTGIVIPKPELQKRLLDLITSSTYSELHNPNYSIIANPYNSKYQNCTEHVLDVLNAAIYQTSDMKQIKRNTRAYYEAQKLDIGPLKLMAGSLFMPGLKTADQKNGLRTSTFRSIAKYMEKYGLAQEQLVVTH